MSERHAVVIGAGIGGLSAAIDLRSSGYRVSLVEQASAPGGRMRELTAGGIGVDSGPTVFTMRWVFDELLESAGLELESLVDIEAAETLARHAWLDGSRLDLHADVERSAAAIESFADAGEAEAYRRFARRSRQIFDTLDHSFMRREKPGPVGLGLAVGLLRLHRLVQTRPFTTLWDELGHQFNDPRLRQLFGRYATYCGSSPLQSPATLQLIAHAERAGVWMVRGGMQRFAEALSSACEAQGVELVYGEAVAEIRVLNGRAAGVRLANGEIIDADAVVFNGDANALSEGLLGEASAKSVPDRREEKRSLSAMTWSLHARPNDFPLLYHSVFFGNDYESEFEAIFERSSVCEEPTLYVCAQDRLAGAETSGSERLFVLMNAPPRPLSDAEIDDFERRCFAMLDRHGLTFDIMSCVRTTPNDFAERFPGSGGAIYGWPTHGWSGSFRRHGSRSAIRGLYLAGGTVHPGPGVPMVALSGRIAAQALRRDLAQS